MPTESYTPIANGNGGRIAVVGHTSGGTLCFDREGKYVVVLDTPATTPAIPAAPSTPMAPSTPALPKNVITVHVEDNGTLVTLALPLTTKVSRLVREFNNRYPIILRGSDGAESVPSLLDPVVQDGTYVYYHNEITADAE